jgi:hypothetical protein
VGNREWGVRSQVSNFFGPIPHSRLPTPDLLIELFVPSGVPKLDAELNY